VFQEYSNTSFIIRSNKASSYVMYIKTQNRASSQYNCNTRFTSGKQIKLQHNVHVVLNKKGSSPPPHCHWKLQHETLMHYRLRLSSLCAPLTIDLPRCPQQLVGYDVSQVTPCSIGDETSGHDIGGERIGDGRRGDCCGAVNRC